MEVVGSLEPPALSATLWPEVADRWTTSLPPAPLSTAFGLWLAPLNGFTHQSSRARKSRHCFVFAEALAVAVAVNDGR